MNPPPLPSPHRFTCSNCGFGWDEATPYCPHCGQAQAPLQRPRAGAGVLIALGCGFIVFGAMGACFSYIGLGQAFDSSPANAFSFMGLALIALALFLLWKLVRGGR